MSEVKRIVVIGADAAGMSAAHQALRSAKARGRDIDVVVLEKTRHTSYSACGIPYWIAGDVEDQVRLLARTADQHRGMGVDLRMGATAAEVDLDRGRVGYRTADDGVAEVPFDELIFATGAHPVIPDWARSAGGDPFPGVHPVKTLDDGERWLDLLGTAPEHGLVVGGGYIGVEMAEALVRRGVRTTLLTRSRVMSNLDPDMSERIETALTDAGVDIVTDDTVACLGTRHAVTNGGRRIRADVVALGLGVRPSSELGEKAGIPVGRSGGYVPDENGRVGAGVWAAGDCCESRHRLTGDYVFTPLGTHANKQGRAVGENIMGGSAGFGTVLGTAITRFVVADQHVEIARTGLNSAEASAAGRNVASLVTEGRTASGYMPEAAPMATKIIADSDSRQLLGVQIVGGQAAGKRIDTAAATLWGSLTVDDLAAMDLAYAPPFATVWEAVQLAARRLTSRF